MRDALFVRCTPCRAFVADKTVAKTVIISLGIAVCMSAAGLPFMNGFLILVMHVVAVAIDRKTFPEIAVFSWTVALDFFA